MNVVISMDSFKGSLSSMEAGNTVKEAILKIYSQAEVVVRPLADGGEGTVKALSVGMGGKIVTVAVTGPLGEQVQAEYCILEDGKTVILEMASAAGITLVKKERRNPLVTTTYGVGELIKDGIARGCRHFIIGIGGSATNDGGAGMLQALGFDLLDHKGRTIPLGARGLECIHRISDKNALPELKECSFRIANDVTNPLCGKDGCSRVYGAQKGASPQDMERMDLWLSRYAQIAENVTHKSCKDFPGAGAAGGLGFAFLTFTNAILESGVKIVLEETGIEDCIRDADLVITGEGRLDGQTVMGKAPIGVARLAKKYGKKVIAFSGCVGDEEVLCRDMGIDAFFPVLRDITTLEEALDKENAAYNLYQTVYQVFRLIRMYDGESGKR